MGYCPLALSLAHKVKIKISLCEKIFQVFFHMVDFIYTEMKSDDVI